jgi:hypothetical protein
MCLAGTSTTRPSGSLRPSLTRVSNSVPSGLEDSTRLPPASKKNKRLAMGLEMALRALVRQHKRTLNH